ncbi:MAG: ABC transporter permease [Anaerolineales bacterium]|nr:ABC transporter permease [Anaerolineales bacterium]MCS7249011.1 ABC transporter permease [Anaerolineales bacterium]MDW8162824.1 ABC transporter permease [Anaerolineales bacterium]MDW8447884.1 ABC transporter permease [Anaerolineales bacterium]
MTAQATSRNSGQYISPARERAMGVFFLIVAAAMWFFFLRTTEPGVMTTFGMTPGGSKVKAPDWVFETALALQVLIFLTAFLGVYQLARGFKQYTNLVLGIVSGFFIFAFLAWGTSGVSLNLAGLLRVMVIRSVPLTLGALSGILCERSGVFNIAIEGMMLTAAFTATLFGSVTHNLWIGLVTGMLSGLLLGGVLAVLAIKYKVNQIIAGTVINIFSTGLTSFLSAKFLQKYQHLNDPGRFPNWDFPGLSQIPFIGPIFFSHNLYVYAMYVLVVVLTVALFYTRWGLRLRSVGEHPKAADTLGIPVNRTRYMAVLLGGLVAGFAGTYFTLGSVGRFDEVLTAGRGFIALAAMIFGNWNPFGAFGAGLLFGFSDSLAGKLTILRVPIHNKFLEMAPYLVTIIVLAGVIGRAQPPAAGGKPYEKE